MQVKLGLGSGVEGHVRSADGSAAMSAGLFFGDVENDLRCAVHDLRNPIKTRSDNGIATHLHDSFHPARVSVECIACLGKYIQRAKSGGRTTDKTRSPIMRWLFTNRDPISRLSGFVRYRSWNGMSKQQFSLW